MDNASFHKGKEMQQAIELAGHTLLYLPPYSPDFNPIENKWSQSKSIKRRDVLKTCLRIMLCSQIINE